MKVHLMYRDHDFDLAQAPPPCADDLVQDLELATLWRAMSRDDKWLAEVVSKAVLVSSMDLETILYRQDILKDCLRNEVAIRGLYDLAVETIEAERKGYLSLMRYPGAILYRSLEVLQMAVIMLQRLRGLADAQIDKVESEGFRALFAMLRAELSDDYLTNVRDHLKYLRFQDGILLSAQLGEGNMGVNYLLRKEPAPDGGWLRRMFMAGPPSYSFQVHPQDVGGARALEELRNRGINLVANALAQSADHILNFFRALRTELAFYVGCLNLHGRLSAQGEPVCFPRPAAHGERRLSVVGLYDASLALTLGRRVVGNQLDADNKDLVMVTGANEGGKSTLLRSLGQAQFMMQCGMFVPAEAFCANLCRRVFTHYKREEDTAMESGKLDEELGRMSRIVDNLTADSLVLFNESFAATNEREGSEIARQIIGALVERHVKVYIVTHQYELARGFYEKNLPSALFLRAERQADGSRTFKIAEGQPLQTSHGEDLYRQIFFDAAP